MSNRFRVRMILEYLPRDTPDDGEFKELLSMRSNVTLRWPDEDSMVLAREVVKRLDGFADVMEKEIPTVGYGDPCPAPSAASGTVAAAGDGR